MDLFFCLVLCAVWWLSCAPSVTVGAFLAELSCFTFFLSSFVPFAFLLVPFFVPCSSGSIRCRVHWCHTVPQLHLFCATLSCFPHLWQCMALKPALTLSCLSLVSCMASHLVHAIILVRYVGVPGSLPSTSCSFLLLTLNFLCHLTAAPTAILAIRSRILPPFSLFASFPVFPELLIRFCVVRHFLFEDGVGNVFFFFFA